MKTNISFLFTTFALIAGCLQDPKLDEVGSESIVAASPPPQVCRCYPAAGGSVACPDCDNETIPELCHTHDNACTAANGGMLAFCSTYTPPPPVATPTPTPAIETSPLTTATPPLTSETPLP